MSYEHELRSFHKIADSILSVLIIEVPMVLKKAFRGLVKISSICIIISAVLHVVKNVLSF